MTRKISREFYTRSIDFEKRMWYTYGIEHEGKSSEREEHMLTITHLTKRYGEKLAVDDLSLHIAPGEIYGFIGHNGAGKTTTLKSVVGILPFEEGEITIGGV